MSTRLLVIFLLILAIPLALLSWVGWLLYEQDQIAADSQLADLNRTQLRSVETQLQDQFVDYATEFSAVLQLLNTDTDSLRYVARRHPLIRQMVLLDAQGRRMHPPTNQALSQDERALLTRAASVFNGGLLASDANDLVRDRNRLESSSSTKVLGNSAANRVIYDNVLKAPDTRYTEAAQSVQASDAVGDVAFNDVVDSYRSLGQGSRIAEAAPSMTEAEADDAESAGSVYATESRGGSEQQATSAEVVDFDRNASSPELDANNAYRSASPLERVVDAKSINTNAIAASGWYSWHHDRELHHLFWQRLPDGKMLAFEVDPARAKADLIARLPTTLNAALVDLPESKYASLATFNDGIRLIDAHGDVVYQWGQYFLLGAAKSVSVQRPNLTHALSAPLSAWRLEYFRAPKANHYSRYFLMVIVVVGALLLLLLLVVYFWREQHRTASLARQRVSFVNQVSHELKTPLTNVRMYAEMAAAAESVERAEHNEQDEPSLIRGYLDVIVTESQRLSRLISNVLNFARSQREQIALHKRTLVPDEVIQQVLDNFAPALQDHDLQLIANLQATDAVQVDADIVEQILNNLLSNVEKYAHAGERVIVNSSLQQVTSGHQLVIRVQDFGPGISAADHARVFEPFYRASNKLTDGVSGTGIGLNIARELAVLHGGDLQLQANQSGESGCVFVVTLNVDHG